MYDLSRLLWALVFLVTTAAVVVTAIRSLANERSKAFKAIALYAAFAGGILGPVAAIAALIAP